MYSNLHLSNFWKITWLKGISINLMLMIVILLSLTFNEKVQAQTYGPPMFTEDFGTVPSSDNLDTHRGDIAGRGTIGSSFWLWPYTCPGTNGWMTLPSTTLPEKSYAKPLPADEQGVTKWVFFPVPVLSGTPYTGIYNQNDNYFWCLKADNSWSAANPVSCNGQLVRWYQVCGTWKIGHWERYRLRESVVCGASWHNTMDDGGYALSANPFYVHGQTAWHTGPDHTGDARGRMLVVNAALQKGLFYKRQIDGLCYGAQFDFRAFYQNVLLPASCSGGGLPINIRFEVWDKDPGDDEANALIPVNGFACNNAKLLAQNNTNDIAATASITWYQNDLTFTVPQNQNFVFIILRNNSNGGCGNDLAIDDISFRPYIPFTIGYTATIDYCTTGTVSLKGSINSGSVPLGYVFQWQVSSDNGNNWTNVGIPFSNINTPLILSVININNKLYRIISAASADNFNNLNCYVASANFNGNSVKIPTATLSPTSLDVCGTVNHTPVNASFSVKYQGNIFPWSYTWSINGVAQPAVTVPASVTVSNKTIAITNNVTVTLNQILTPVAQGGCTITLDTQLPITYSYAAPIGSATITGPNPACIGATADFCVTPVPGAYSYQWNVSNGWSIISGQGQQCAKLLIGASAITVSITSSNACGNNLTTASAPFQTTYNPPPAPADITIPNGLCFPSSSTQGSKDILFTASEVLGTDNYIWSWDPQVSLSLNQQIGVTGQNLQSIILTVPNGVTSYYVSVISQNLCGTSTARTVTFTPKRLIAVCKNITVQLDATGNVGITGVQVDNGSISNCPIQSLNVSPNTFTCSNIGNNTVTLTVTDNDGNISTCTATVTVEDNIKPSITCNENINVDNDKDVCGAVVTYKVEYSDNCQGATLEQTAGLASGSVFPVGTTTNTFVVTDAAGLTATCSFDVTVKDTQIPSITCNEDINVDNDKDVCGAVVTYKVEYSDNCQGATLEQIAGLASGSVFPVGTTTNTFVVTDAAGLTNTCNFDVTVKDTQIPSITCNEDINVDNDNDVCGAAITYKVEYSDNCQGATLEQIAGLASGSVFPVGTTTNTFVVTDAAGLTNTCSFDVTVKDTQIPSITCNEDINVDNDNDVCGATVTYKVEYTDNCKGATIEQTAGLASGSVFPIGTTTNTFVVTDAAGLTNTCSFDVTVKDTQIPSITCNEDINVDNDNDVCGAVVTYKVEYSDNCQGATLEQTAGLASGSVFPVGTTTNTFVVTDAAGLTNTCSFDVTVKDTQIPSITCNEDINVDNDNDVCGAVVTYKVEYSDNCQGATLEQTAGLASGSVFPVGTTTNTFVVTDAAGLTNTCSFDVTVKDTQIPSITCNEDINVENDKDVCGATVTYKVEYTDNCKGATIEQTAGLASGSVFPIGTTTNTFVVTDAAGLTNTCSFDVTVKDTQIPSITCNEDINVENDKDVCGATVTYKVEYSDNCQGATLEQTAGLASGSVFPVGTTTNTFVVTDAAGLTNTCSFDVTVKDTQIPSITCNEDINVENDKDVCGATVTYKVEYTDNCKGATIEQTAGLASGSVFPIGTTTNTFVVTDAAGLTNTCSFDVTVKDTQIPSITCNEDINVDNDKDVCGATVTYKVEYTDNCQGATLEQTAGLASGSVFPVGTTTNTFVVTDAAGLTATCSFDVTVKDTQIPSITCNENINVDNDKDVCGAVVTYKVEYSDNCKGATLEQTAGLASGSVFPIGTTTNTFVVTDAAGLTNTCSFDVTVKDTQIPSITCNEDINVENDKDVCGATVTYKVEYTDNCKGATIEQTAGLASGSVFPIGTTTNTFVVTDAAGLTNTCSFDVTVKDTQIPSITCNEDINVDNDNDVCGAVVTYKVEYSDNCQGATLEQTAGLASGSVFPVGTTTNTFVVTDAAGLTNTCSFDVTVKDTQIPSITCNEDINVENDKDVCGATVTYKVEYTDNCKGATIEQTAGLASGSVFPIGTTTNTFVVTDAAGLTNTCSFDVTVKDTQKPTILECAINQSAAANENCQAIVPDYTKGIKAIDNCTAAENITITQSPLAGTVVGPGLTIVTITVKDENGNSETCTTEFNVTSFILANNDSGIMVNGLTGGTSFINVLWNDQLNCNAVNSSDVNVTFISATNAGVSLVGTNVVVAPGTPAGNYTLTYQICEVINPTNCSQAIVTVPVTAATIDAIDDSGLTINGYNGGTSFTNVLGNDLLNGLAVIPSEVNLTFISATNPGVTLVGTDVVVAAGTPAGNYTLTYKICEVLNPTNCDQAIVTVPVIVPEIDAIDDSGLTINGYNGGTSFTNVLGNDLLNGLAVIPSEVNLTFISATNPGVTLVGTDVLVAAGTPAGNYTLTYKICEVLNPSNCDEAIVTVPVIVPEIDAIDDSGLTINGYNGGTSFTNVLGNDLLNGLAVIPSEVNLTFISATNPGVTLVGTDVIVAAGTPAGNYTLTYKICEVLNPTNCDQANVTVEVTAPNIDAIDDSGIAVNGYTGGTSFTNVLGNDLLNGLAVIPSEVNLTFISATNPGVTLVGTDVIVAAGTPAGNYTLTYKICEVLNPTNCDQANVTVEVTAPNIDAIDDSGIAVNGYTGGTSFTNVLGNDLLNGLAVIPSEVNLTFISATNPGVTLVGTDVIVAAGTPAGNYTLTYKICEVLNPTNCDQANVTVEVTAPNIDAIDDSGIAVNGYTGGTSFTNVLGNDLLNGLAVIPSEVNLTFISATNPGVTLVGTDVIVAAGTPAGNYTLTYKICEVLNPTNCDQANVTVEVTAPNIDAIDDSGIAVNGYTGGTSFTNVLGNDLLNGLAVIPAEVNLTFISATNPGVTLVGTDVVVAAGTPAGNYTLTYKICEVLNPTNCDQANVTVEVTAPNIDAIDDSGIAVNGYTGGTSFTNVLGNDLLNGLAVIPSEVNLTFISATNPGVTLVGTDVVVAAGTPAGNYTLTYKICEVLNPTNCDQANVTVEVTAPNIDAIDDSGIAVNGYTGGTSFTNVLGNDLLNGLAVIPAEVNLTFISATNPGVTLVGTDVLVAAGTPAGNYTLTYKICEVLNPSNCDEAIVTVPVLNNPPVAVDNSAITAYETPITLNITGNDYDLDGSIDPSTVDLDPSTAGQQTTITTVEGTWIVDASGNVTFTPALNFIGTATLPYTVKDNEGATSNIAYIRIEVLDNPCKEPVQANAGDDVKICKNSNTELNATGGTLYAWSPAEGLSNPNIANPIASPSVTTTYTVTVYAPSGELVPNGNFEGGNIGFTSSYGYVFTPYNGSSSSGLYPEGKYAITSDPHYPNNYHPNFYGTGHGGSGQFMAVNGATILGVEVWGKVVAVTPNTTYYFSTWISSINPSSLANLAFTINDDLLGPVITPPAMIGNNNQWLQFYAEWKSGPTATTADIKIVNQNIIAGGNDFGLDDISFTTVCSATDEVVVNIDDVPLTAEINTQTNVLCYGNNTGSATVKVTSGSGSYTYLWSTDPAQGDATATDLTAGNYTVTVKDNNGCNSTTLNVEITQPKYTLSAEITAQTNVSVFGGNDGSATANGIGGTSPYTYEWSNGQTDATSTGLIAGIYNVTVTDANKCIATTKVTITEPSCIAPEITSLDVLPGNQIFEGTPITFNVIATGTETLSYQWYKNDFIITDATKSSFAISSPQLISDNGTYKVVVSNSCGNTESNVIITLIPCFPPSIIDQPTNGDEICKGNTFTFSVTAVAGTTYQWFKGDGTILSGETHATFTTGIAGDYYAIVGWADDNCDATIKSDIITLKVNDIPLVNCMETVTKVNTGEVKQFCVTLVSGTNVKYQWSFNGDIIAGETNNCYTRTILATDDQKIVTVNVSNECGSTDCFTNLEMSCVVPYITIQPKDKESCEGKSTTFSVTASGTTPMLYQWYFNNAPIAGATESTYSITSTEPSNIGSYYVVIKNSCTCEETICDIKGFKTFTQGGWGTNCFGGNPGCIRDAHFNTVFPSGLIIGCNNTLTLTTSQAVADYLPDGGTPNVYTQNYVDPTSQISVLSGQLVALKLNVKFDAMGFLGINPTHLGSLVIATGPFSGMTVNAFLTQAEKAIGGCGLSGRTLDEYVCAADNINKNFEGGFCNRGFLICGTSTTICNGIKSNIVILKVDKAPSITSLVKTEGCVNPNLPAQTFEFTVTATGTAPLNYQWYYNGAEIIGATSTKYTLVTNINSGDYKVVVSNNCGSVEKTLTLEKCPCTPPSIVEQPSSSTICEGANKFTVVGGGTNLMYQWYNCNGSSIMNATTASYSTGTAGCYYVVVSSGDENCGSPATSEPVTLIVNTPPSVTINEGGELCEGGSFTFTATATGTPTLTYQWYNNGGVIAGATKSTFTLINVTMDDDDTYYVVVKNLCGSTKSNTSTLIIDKKVLVSCPSNEKVCGDKTATFSVTATGTGPFTYQWYANNAIINDGPQYNGTQTYKLTVLNVAGLDGTEFKVVVTGKCNSVTSCEATLTVGIPPVITDQPDDVKLCVTKCTCYPKACFEVTATGTGLTYQWQEDGVNINDGGYFTGTHTSKMCVINTKCKDGKKYRVIITNACGSVTSDLSTLKIMYPPTITKKPASICVKEGEAATFTVKATNAITYQWQMNGVDIPGATKSVLTITNVTGMNNKQFRVIACNDCGCVTSCPATLLVKPGCNPPTNLRSCEVTSYSGKIVWNTVSGAKSYEVQIWSSDGKFNKTYTTINPMYILCYLKSNTEYCWKVRTKCYTCGCATSCGGNKSSECYSDWSETKCFKTGICVCKGTKSTTDNTISVNDMSVYPNPTTGVVNVTLPELSTASDLTIFNMSGQLVYSEKVSTLNNGSIKQLDMSAYQQGVYFVRLNNEQYVKTIKLILQ